MSRAKSDSRATLRRACRSTCTRRVCRAAGKASAQPPVSGHEAVVPRALRGLVPVLPELPVGIAFKEHLLNAAPPHVGRVEVPIVVARARRVSVELVQHAPEVRKALPS